MLRWDHTLKRGRIEGRLDNQPTEIPHVRTFAGHIEQRPYLEASRAYGTETYILPRYVHCGGKGTAPGCAHMVGAQRYQADSWPCNMESGWAAHYGRLDMTFEAMCQHLVQNQFTSDAFQGDSESYLFQWDTNVWDTWPEIEGHDFKEDWDKEGHINHPKRSETLLTTDDIQQLHRDTPAHNELMAPMNEFMRRQFANQEPLPGCQTARGPCANGSCDLS